MGVAVVSFNAGATNAPPTTINPGVSLAGQNGDNAAVVTGGNLRVSSPERTSLPAATPAAEDPIAAETQRREITESGLGRRSSAADSEEGRPSGDRCYVTGVTCPVANSSNFGQFRQIPYSGKYNLLI